MQASVHNDDHRTEQVLDDNKSSIATETSSVAAVEVRGRCDTGVDDADELKSNYGDDGVSDDEAPPDRSEDAPQMGARIEIFWRDDAAWYACTVGGFDASTRMHALIYEGGVHETLGLLEHAWRPAPSIGSCIRILWEDDAEWYTAQVLGVTCDPNDDRARHHKVQYVEDGVVEAIDLRYEMWEADPTSPGIDKVLCKPTPRHHRATTTQAPTLKSVQPLIDHVAVHGGDASMLTGWRCLRYMRGVAGGRTKRSGSGDSYVVFQAPSGVKYRSKKEVVAALGLAGNASSPSPPALKKPRLAQPQVTVVNSSSAN